MASLRSLAGCMVLQLARWKMEIMVVKVLSVCDADVERGWSQRLETRRGREENRRLAPTSDLVGRCDSCETWRVIAESWFWLFLSWISADQLGFSLCLSSMTSLLSESICGGAYGWWRLVSLNPKDHQASKFSAVVRVRRALSPLAYGELIQYLDEI